MHLFFSGIGGSGISALANIALDLGFKVSGSDVLENENILNLRKRGAGIVIDQSEQAISRCHEDSAINWLTYSSSIPKNSPEITFAKENNIKISKRDDFINFIVRKEKLKLLAVAGTHGKTTTSAMLSWLFYSLKIPVTQIIGSNLSWSQNGTFQKNSKYLILEADEYDKNFLAYSPFASILTSISYDHQDTYPKKEDYLEAFREFLVGNKMVFAFNEDLKKLNLKIWSERKSLDMPVIYQLKKIFAGKVFPYSHINLLGLHNRQNGALTSSLFSKILELEGISSEKNIEEILASFPGSQRRMEKLENNIYTDYAHHPEEIQATLQLATELKKPIVVVYQPHQNTRQHQILPDYKYAFVNAEKVYWLPTYLTRENPNLPILTFQNFAEVLSEPNKAIASDMNTELLKNLAKDYQEGKLILFVGAGSIDSWARKNLKHLLPSF